MDLAEIFWTLLEAGDGSYIYCTVVRCTLAISQGSHSCTLSTLRCTQRALLRGHSRTTSLISLCSKVPLDCWPQTGQPDAPTLAGTTSIYSSNMCEVASGVIQGSEPGGNRRLAKSRTSPSKTLVHMKESRSAFVKSPRFDVNPGLGG